MTPAANPHLTPSEAAAWCDVGPAEVVAAVETGDLRSVHGRIAVRHLELWLRARLADRTIHLSDDLVELDTHPDQAI
jgi:hypothetical protein